MLSADAALNASRGHWSVVNELHWVLEPWAPGSRAAGLAMVFKLLLTAEQSWRKLNGHELVPLVRAGAKFIDGVRVERDAEAVGSIDAVIAHSIGSTAALLAFGSIAGMKRPAATAWWQSSPTNKNAVNAAGGGQPWRRLASTCTRWQPRCAS